MDVKGWLEQTGLPAAEACYQKPPPLPYLVYLEDRQRRGADQRGLLTKRSVTVELYSARIDPRAQAAVEALLEEAGLPYQKQGSAWVPGEGFFQTVYTFELIEKDRYQK